MVASDGSRQRKGVYGAIPSSERQGRDSVMWMACKKEEQERGKRSVSRVIRWDEVDAAEVCVWRRNQGKK
ncbi:unnamed protein product [Linum trigynum]|uniref:Uncharacterized protein n=1 Tax=Linum trigynum TaxID=586398 RepID=A0AAV2GM92_9ROSI